MNIAGREIQLANGDIIPVGMNFYTLNLMTKYNGGLVKLQKDMQRLKIVDEESEEYSETLPLAMDAMGYMLWALVRSGGTQCTVEQCAMSISPDDFAEIYSIMEEFTEAANRMTAGKNAPGRMA